MSERTITDYMREANNIAFEKGWWDGPERNFGEQVALMHTELSEAFEEYRKFGLQDESLLYTDIRRIEGAPLFANIEGNKPEGIAAEFADVLIRMFDTCQRYSIPLVQALNEKMEYNKTRPYRHGGKLA